MVIPLATETPRELARLEALRRYGIVDTATEPEFDELVKRAARECGYATALLTFMEADRCWFKAVTGGLVEHAGIRELPRPATFCNYALQSSGIFVVPDARKDERFRHLPTINEPGGYRSYVGAQLITPDGFSIGTLCLLDTGPREPTADQRTALRQLADRAVELLEQRQRDLLPAAPVSLAPAPPSSAPRYVASRDLLLVVDDDEMVRSVTGAMLQRLGHDVRFATDGRDALRLIASAGGRVRLIVTDVHMPEMNGIELAHAARRMPHAPAVVAMSGKFDDRIRAELTAAGVIAMFAKPFGLAELEHAIEQVQARAP